MKVDHLGDEERFARETLLLAEGTLTEVPEKEKAPPAPAGMDGY